jgi:hypothetical protein
LKDGKELTLFFHPEHHTLMPLAPGLKPAKVVRLDVAIEGFLGGK